MTRKTQFVCQHLENISRQTPHLQRLDLLAIRTRPGDGNKGKNGVEESGMKNAP